MYSNSFLTSKITQLERQNISLIDSISIFKSVQNKLNDVVDEVGDALNRKLNYVLKKNNGFSILQNISKILNGEITSMDELSESLTVNDLIYFKYAPITSANVERSFSRCKNILSNNRRRLDVKNIKKNFSGSMQQIYRFEKIIIKYITKLIIYKIVFLFF